MKLYQWPREGFILPGLSAAGISSGLAAIGSAVGVGMAAGTMIAVAAPALAAAVVGYLVYQFARMLTPEAPASARS